jgi:hypothetical protein
MSISWLSEFEYGDLLLQKQLLKQLKPIVHDDSKNIVYLYSLFNAFLYVRFVINKELQDMNE